MTVTGRILQLAAWPKRVAADAAAVAMTEFALALPMLVILGMAGSELSNYITTKMRMSQVALQIADNASRMGTGATTGLKSVSESNINEVFAGSQLQSGALDLKTNGRVILSDLEPVASPNTTSKYRIQWQRCFGAKTAHGSLYGKQGDTNLSGIGPTGLQVTAQDYNATMFVEVYYVYQPIISSTFLPAANATFDEVASMAVRDARTLSVMPSNAENAVASTC